MTNAAFFGIADKLIEKFSEEFAKKFGVEVYELAKKKRFFDRLIDTVKKFFLLFYQRRTLFIIGAGEIATEISIAAINKGWRVVAVGREAEYSPLDEKAPISVKNIPYYRHVRIKEKQGLYFERWPSKEKSFQWAVREKLDTDTLCDMITYVKPDVVLLEDMFLLPDKWINLYQKVLETFSAKGIQNKVLFLPPVLEFRDKKYSVSDILMSKKHQKEFLASIRFAEHLLGTPNDVIEVDIRGGKIKSDGTSKIASALQKSKKIILKWDTISSGHGQIVIEDLSQLTPDIIQQSIKYSQRRVRNTYYVIDKYLDNKKEAIVIVAKTKEGLKILDGIYYEKYDVEKIKEQRYKFLSRLKRSETMKGDPTLWDYLNKIAIKISKMLPIPFVYVEFLLDVTEKLSVPKIYINEVSYRPDDAGFVTLLSHDESQFSIFMDSLEWWLAGAGGFNSAMKKTIRYEEGIACVTICPKEKIDRWPRENIGYPMLKGPRAKHFIINFYEKFVLERDGTVDYGRIVGFIWHHKETDPMIILNEFKEALDLGELFRIVYEFLEEQSKGD
ncbi:MAG: hypothetical protein QMD12_03240 [Candidatus Aenigmarchaeota archaeon]|nr:hypothetical protein [Candidatus Aenigmarchaeota archaeon]